MKIILFDSIVSGHHGDYARYLAQRLLERGDTVTFATTALAAEMNAVRGFPPHVDVQVVGQPARGRGASRIGRLIQMRESITRCGHLADSQNADVFHHLFLDGTELAWLTAPPRSKRDWTTFASRFTLEHRVPGETRLHAQSIAAFAKHRALRSAVSQRRLDGIFVHSPRAEAATVQLLGRRAPRDTVTFIVDPVPPTNTAQQRSARERLQLPTDKPILLFFGGLRHNKGPDVFLRALASVRGDWTAVVAGEPLSVVEREIRALTEALPHPSRVILRLGVIPDSDIDGYFAAADAVVLPYRESYGSIGASSGVLMRATAAARPVIVSDVGDVGPIVRANGLGIVVPAESAEALAAALTSYLTNREQVASDVAPRASAYAHDNSWQVMGDAVRAAYENQLLRGRNN